MLVNMHCVFILFKKTIVIIIDYALLDYIHAYLAIFHSNYKSLYVNYSIMCWIIEIFKDNLLLDKVYEFQSLKN